MAVSILRAISNRFEIVISLTFVRPASLALSLTSVLAVDLRIPGASEKISFFFFHLFCLEESCVVKRRFSARSSECKPG